LEIKQLSNNKSNNNKIEGLCNGDLKPIKYNDLPETLRKPLKQFFNDLYEKVLKREPFEGKYETTKAYFDKLMKANRGLTVCPFCALVDLKSQFHNGRDAFDHYLPKGTYPFISVNFLNLAPICHPCNSGDKLSTDPLFNDEGRVRVIFPFGNLAIDPFSLQIIIDNQLLIVERIKPDDIYLNLQNDERVKNWNRVFGINKRYIATICQKSKEWVRHWHNLYRSKNIQTTLEDFIEIRLEEYTSRPLQDEFFLRYAIFNALNEHGLLAQSLEDSITT
jgi:hypothetical protein